MNCDKCTHAKWKLTVDGRKHPSKEGRCGWTTPELPVLPSSMSWGWGCEPKPQGGYIRRGIELLADCACHEEKK